MKFSTLSLQLLKNFANINTSIYFREGNKLRTISPQQDILVDAEIPDSIPVDFGVYDLNNFLSVLSIHEDSNAIVEFEDKNVIIKSSDSRSKIRYRFCEPSMIVRPPEKQIVIDNPEMNFDLSADDLKWVLKTASVLNCPHITFSCDGDKLTVNALNVSDNSAHTNSLELGEDSGKKYNIIFKAEKIQKLFPGKYSVSISSKGIASFQCKDVTLKYFLSTETGSDYSDA